MLLMVVIACRHWRMVLVVLAMLVARAAHPTEPSPTVVVLVRRRSLLALTPMAIIDWPGLPYAAKHMFQIYGCCICCNGCTRILQNYVFNVASVFFKRMLQVCLSDVTYVSHIC
jgi:hypothetical protein